MRYPFPVLAALACTSLFNPLASQSAIAGANESVSPTEKPWMPQHLPPGTVSKAGQTPQPAKPTGCDGVRSEYFAGPRLDFRQVAGNFADRLADVPQVQTSLQVKVTASKRITRAATWTSAADASTWSSTPLPTRARTAWSSSWPT